VALILSIETATEVCSVALADDDRLLSQRTLEKGMRYSAILTTLINEVVVESGYFMKNISAVAISNGPGSYTGLRVGASTAKGICHALDIPLIAVSTLESLAYTIKGGDPVMATIDARRMEVYAAIYSGKKIMEDVHALIWSSESIQNLSNKYNSLTICGNGVTKAELLLNNYDHIIRHPSECNAALLVPLAHESFQKESFADIAYHDPFYYKSPNITVPKSLI